MIREDAGLSLSDVARAVGTDAATVYRWESGHKRPSARYAQGYRDLLQELGDLRSALRRHRGTRGGTP
jgi:DNA-binding transcriptional regulator YiaG